MTVNNHDCLNYLKNPEPRAKSIKAIKKDIKNHLKDKNNFITSIKSGEKSLKISIDGINEKTLACINYISKGNFEKKDKISLKFYKVISI